MFKRRWFQALLLFTAILLIVYISGPHPSAPVYVHSLPAVPSSPSALENYIHVQEAAHKLKPGNEARVVWANDSNKAKTPYSIVYLHGFSASQEEGRPIHTNIAREFGCNLYLSRLSQHGIDTIQPMINLTPENFWESACQALAMGKQLGDNVILMSTSTGGTLSLKLAAEFPQDVYALIMMSPNVAINNKLAFLLNNPWGLQIAHMVTGSDYITASDSRDIYKKYWYQQYPLEAAVQLQELLETTMNRETFEKVTQPVLLLYYYKDEKHQDSVVSVPAMLKMFNELGTPTNLKIKQSVPDVGNHVMGSYIKSTDLLEVQQAIESFMQNKLNIPMQP